MLDCVKCDKGFMQQEREFDENGRLVIKFRLACLPLQRNMQRGKTTK